MVTRSLVLIPLADVCVVCLSAMPSESRSLVLTPLAAICVVCLSVMSSASVSSARPRCRLRLCRLLVRGATCVRLASFGLGHAIDSNKSTGLVECLGINLGVLQLNVNPFYGLLTY